ncbi:MAG: formate acetyltransferase [Hapalosiphonaceae cyanobacterium JJU2]|nr:MAG: formate acetyltransferase [Hapalosiphonaceae cyanobacterium JJU2]
MNTPGICPFHGVERRAEDLSTAQGDRLSYMIWQYVQRGLVYPSPHARFVTFWRYSQGSGQPLTKAVLTRLMADLRAEIHTHYGSTNTTAIVGVGFTLWNRWCADDSIPVPVAIKQFLEKYPDGVFPAFARSAGTLEDSQGDLWFHIKSDNDDYCEGVLKFIRERLEKVEQCVDPARTVYQAASTKSITPDKLGGKVLGCRFSENLNNPSDPITIQEQTIVGFEDPVHVGASYSLSQRFFINWNNILNMSPDEIEDLVGRTTDDILIPTRDTRSHIKCSRVQDEQGNTTRILRLGLPFGQSSAIHNQDLQRKGASLRDEAGIYFAGYAKDVTVLESILDSQIGFETGCIRDRLLTNVNSDLGGLFYIPSQVDLGLNPIELKTYEEMDWKYFPGVDWSRLDRHFTLRSKNGYMYYNHKDYLYRMGTMTAEEKLQFLPPSSRVLRLLANTFSRWEDNWYFDRSQQKMEHLQVYVERQYGSDKAAEVMSLSVAERMGWAIKMSVGYVLVSHEYGFRGRKQQPNDNWLNGADTYRIQPQELIVGGLPNLGLGQGRYVMDYTREDEQIPNFFRGLSYASGVGHVVPGFQRVLDLGIGGLILDIQKRLDSTTDVKKQEFYKASILALEGVRDHCIAYAKLAGEMANELPEGKQAERENLEAIATRMTKLATQPPATMLEAAQLILTYHACLQLVGEPTAIGRLDQMLYPFYERDMAEGRLNDDLAQEIIDCFWIKVGEKVQLNRTMVEDHQPYGNLAMGGMSGNYPQGAANNQWIQQVTVGGTIADNSPGEGLPAYNKITLLCLRAARRLPLNAPCLSLRVRKDIPSEYLQEAALAILSGGAHPILLSDEKIIPGLQQSGDRIGEGQTPTNYTPVQEKAGVLWRSEVELQDARNYACDGCYEPQIVGKNWFTLGGVLTLQALEAALNQGKSWLTAGPMFFRGQRISFTSIPPREIKSFEQLVDLFLTHIRWMYAKQADGLLGAFGQMSQVCPSPLLSVVIDDCLDKGLDFYAGGPRYNMVAPCFTALANSINSLYAIKHMVFEPSTAVTSLPELVDALMCDWGYSMQEPFISTLAGPARIAAMAERFQKLREVALKLPRYGRGNPEIDKFGDELIRQVAQTAVQVFTDPALPTAQKMVDLAQQLGTPEQPFGGFQIVPGVGTFENYIEFGATTGASADGRRSGESLASDLSPAPSMADFPIDHQEAKFLSVLQGFTGEGSSDYSSGAPTDLNIREDFPAQQLEQVLRAFALGDGSNILTITCANPETFAGATHNPEKYDLIRVRMGGWSEFFVAMFPAHQAQHQRRPLHLPEPSAL